MDEDENGEEEGDLESIGDIQGMLNEAKKGMLQVNNKVASGEESDTSEKVKR